jgi:transposase, IS30 family
MSYRQLTRDQRYQIYALLKAGQNQTEIAAIVACHKSTISRELRRNLGCKGYRPLQAQTLAQGRRYKSHPSRVGEQTWTQVELLLLRQWSPEQIAGRLRLEHKPAVSHEWIYHHIYADKQRGGKLYRQLRSQKKQRKRYGGHARRPHIPNRISIEQRPAVVAAKSRLGDWEADTIIGARHKGAILSCTERKSKLTLLRKLERKGAAEVERNFIDLLRPCAGQVHTITVDNGSEFSHHQRIAAQLETDIYFAHPYASWERGLNENTNGLIRQYFPKKSDFAKISQDHVRSVAARLNNRPRKTLGYRTPNEVFFKQQLVALPS